MALPFSEPNLPLEISPTSQLKAECGRVRFALAQVCPDHAHHMYIYINMHYTWKFNSWKPKEFTKRTFVSRLWWLSLTLTLKNFSVGGHMFYTGLKNICRVCRYTMIYLFTMSPACPHLRPWLTLSVFLCALVIPNDAVIEATGQTFYTKNSDHTFAHLLTNWHYWDGSRA